MAGALGLQAWRCPRRCGGRGPRILTPYVTEADLGALLALWRKLVLCSLLLPEHTPASHVGTLLGMKPPAGLWEEMTSASGLMKREGVDRPGQDVGRPQSRSRLRN